MIKYLVTDKLDNTYIVYADWVLPVADSCDTITFVIKKDNTTKVVAQFVKENIVGFSETAYCEFNDDRCTTCRYVDLTSDQEPCCRCDDCDLWVAKEND